MFEEGGALDDYEFSSDNVNIGEATDLGKTTPGTGQAGLYIEEKDEQLLVDGNATEGGPIDDNYNIDNDDELESKIDNEMNRQPSANTLLKLKKMDHKLLIAQEIEFRKQQVRAMDRGDGPHPLETVVKKEQTLRRPMTVNEEIFLGLGIGYSFSKVRLYSLNWTFPLVALQVSFMYILKDTPVTLFFQNPISEIWNMGQSIAVGSLHVILIYFFISTV